MVFSKFALLDISFRTHCDFDAETIHCAALLVTFYNVMGENSEAVDLWSLAEQPPTCTRAA